MSLDHVAADRRKAIPRLFFLDAFLDAAFKETTILRMRRASSRKRFLPKSSLRSGFRSRTRRGYEGEARETAAESSMETFIEKKGAIAEGNAPF